MRGMRQFLRYGTAGIIADLSVLHVLVRVFGFHPYIANLCGFAAAALHSVIVSRTRSRQIDLVRISGLGVSMPVFIVVDTVMKPFWSRLFSDPQQVFEVGYRFAKVCAVVAALVWEFVMNRYRKSWSEVEGM